MQKHWVMPRHWDVAELKKRRSVNQANYRPHAENGPRWTMPRHWDEKEMRAINADKTRRHRAGLPALVRKRMQNAYGRKRKQWLHPLRKAYMRKKDKIYRTRKLAFLHSLKRGKPCTDCGISFHPCAMDFDHVRGEKLFVIGQQLGKEMNQRQLLEEIAKCELVCANCHRVRTWNRRQALKIAAS